MIKAVLIRSTGERTTLKSYYRWKSLFPNASIHIITLFPFSKAVKETWRIGKLIGGCVIVADADVVPYKSSKDIIETSLHDLKEKSIVNLPNDCWLFGKKRLAGLRVYKQDIFKFLISSSNLVEKHKRPETEVLRELEYRPDVPSIGEHDRQQWYRDVYRKAQHYFYKFTDNKKKTLNTSFLLQYWKTNNHPDFLIAQKAVQNIKTTDFKNASIFPCVENVLAGLNLEEKVPLL